MSDVVTTLGDLPTPCLVLDRSKMERNLARMRDRAETLGVRLRPHCKTAKSAEVARRALGGETGPITVSTMREAQYFADNGFSDITLAVGISPSRLEQAAELRARGDRVRRGPASGPLAHAHRCLAGIPVRRRGPRDGAATGSPQGAGADAWCVHRG